MGGEVGAEKNVPELCILLAESALRLASTGEKKQVEKMMLVIFDLGFEAGELRRYVKEVKDCKRILPDKNEDELARKDVLKENLRKKSSFSAYSSALCKKTILILLRE